MASWRNDYSGRTMQLMCSQYTGMGIYCLSTAGDFLTQRILIISRQRTVLTIEHIRRAMVGVSQKTMVLRVYCKMWGSYPLYSRDITNAFKHFPYVGSHVFPQLTQQTPYSYILNWQREKQEVTLGRTQGEPRFTLITGILTATREPQDIFTSALLSYISPRDYLD